MKIVYIASSIIPSRNANSVHVMKMCCALGRQGHDVTLVVPDAHKEMEFGIEDVYAFYDVDKNFDIKYILWPEVKGKGVLFGFLAAKAVLKLRPDFIYGRNISACFFSSLLSKIPLAYESHSPIIGEGRLLEAFFKMMIRKKQFKFLSVITDALKSYYLNNYSFNGKQVLVFPDAADPVKRTESVKPPLKFLSTPKLKVGYIGSFHAGKGMETIQELISKYDGVEYHIVGGSEKQVSEAKKSIDRHNDVYFYGFLSQREADFIRNNCDVLLAPYMEKVNSAGRIEIGKWMSPLKIFEYMAAGKAIVCSDLPVLREVLNEQNSILVKGNDISQWIYALKKLEDAEFRANLGDKAKEDFLTNYTWDARAKKLIDETRRA